MKDTFTENEKFPPFRQMRLGLVALALSLEKPPTDPLNRDGFGSSPFAFFFNVN